MVVKIIYHAGLALRYFHTYIWLGPFCEILKINIFGGFQKNGYIWVCEDIVNFFLVITLLD